MCKSMFVLIFYWHETLYWTIFNGTLKPTFNPPPRPKPNQNKKFLFNVLTKIVYTFVIKLPMIALTVVLKKI